MPTRDDLPELTIAGSAKFRDQSHLSLAYESWAPVGPEGKVPDKIPGDDRFRERWLEELTKIPIAAGYPEAFARWSSSFRSPADWLAQFTLSSRLLIGHGNASATEVGLTVHHTWGVPIIAGAALKGICAHYAAAMYGPEAHAPEPWALAGAAAERARYQGVRWEGTKIKAGPGDVYRALFGAPDAEDDEEWRKHGSIDWPAGAARGGVVFHDALYVPSSALAGDERGKERESPFVEDVLTVHQKKYYDAAGKPAPGQPEPWPNDYDDPNPVAFLTVRPGAKFLLVLSGGAEEMALAAYILGEALQEWGVGGKTSLGYGRGTVDKRRRSVQ